MSLRAILNSLRITGRGSSIFWGSTDTVWSVSNLFKRGEWIKRFGWVFSRNLQVISAAAFAAAY